MATDKLEVAAVVAALLTLLAILLAEGVGISRASDAEMSPRTVSSSGLHLAFGRNR